MQRLVSVKPSQAPPPGQNNRRSVLVMVSLLVIAGFLATSVLALQNRSERIQVPGTAPGVTAARGAPVATVTVHTVGLVPIKSTAQSSGTVSSRHTVKIGAEQSGLRIISVNVDEGDSVVKGQVLAAMNSEILQAQLARERASLSGALASIEKTRQPNRLEDIAGLQAAYEQAQAAVSQAAANVQRAEANLSNLRIVASRYQKLQAQGAISLQDAQDRHTAATMAGNELAAVRQQLEAARYAARQAEERLAAARNGGRAVDVSISQANADQIRASIRQIEAQIAQTVVRAPAPGIITKRNAEPGQITTPTEPLFMMSMGGALELRAQVPEIDLPAVHTGATVTITPAAPGLQPVISRVREISPIVDPKTRLGTVYINIAPSSGLREGMYASANIELSNRSALAVPTKAIIAEEGEKVVFVLKGNKVSRRVVQTGTTSGAMVEVRSGVSAGERIVLAGAGFLKDNDIVEVSDSSQSTKGSQNHGLQ